jgi:mitotic spindle assembly checkpoint protein MAD1
MSSFLFFVISFNYSGDAGALVDSYISGKITKLKEQIATLEKREER